MFESEEESVVLKIACGILDIKPDEMMNIGEMIKGAIFDPSVESDVMAAEKLKSALSDMSKEQAVIAGMFISGLLRCNLAQHYMQAMTASEDGQETE